MESPSESNHITPFHWLIWVGWVRKYINRFDSISKLSSSPKRSLDWCQCPDNAVMMLQRMKDKQPCFCIPTHIPVWPCLPHPLDRQFSDQNSSILLFICLLPTPHSFSVLLQTFLARRGMAWQTFCFSRNGFANYISLVVSWKDQSPL